MISTGIIRSIDSLGRVVLPKELRRTFGITAAPPMPASCAARYPPARYSCTAKPSAPPARERWRKRSRVDLLSLKRK